jgi:hypothetical protein
MIHYPQKIVLLAYLMWKQSKYEAGKKHLHYFQVAAFLSPIWSPFSLRYTGACYCNLTSAAYMQCL